MRRGALVPAAAACAAAALLSGCPRPARPAHTELMMPEPFSADEATPGVTPHPAPAKALPKPAAHLATTPPAGLIVHFFNVGQGDSILVKGPARSLLVDCGEEVFGKTEHFRDVAAGIGTITGRSAVDYMVVTHFHYDHMGGSRLRNGVWGLLDLGVHVDHIVDRGNFFVGPPTVTGPGLGFLEDVDGWVKDKLVGERKLAHRGKDVIDLGPGVEVEIVAVNGNGVLEAEPASKLDRCPASENDYSIGLVVRYGAFELFLGGDMGGVTTDRWFGPKCESYHDVESTVLSAVGNVEVMKANHHGSEYSSNPVFVGTLRPELTVASSGGAYHHPGKAFVERVSPWSPILVTGAVSADEWPAGPPMDMSVVGDVELSVEVGGAAWWVAGERHLSYDDAAEAKGLDHPGGPGAGTPLSLAAAAR
jgi:beta-lactamase superfamily II metal-dependent hydrolase